MPHQTQMLLADQSGIKRAATLLSDGATVAFATETVYGLGADARNGVAVATIYAAKSRPSFNPLIVHVANLQTAQTYASFSPTARKLADAFWPGPLSLVLPVNPNAGLSSLVTAGLDTVAIRVPAHPISRRLLSDFGGPVAAPSANLSGTISPTTAAHVASGLKGKIDAILDGGACSVGLESTILMVQNTTVSLLRAGGTTAEDIETCLGERLQYPDDPETPQSPGQLTSHYAPNAPIYLEVTAPSSTDLHLAFGPNQSANTTLNLSQSGSLPQAAANLFAHLRTLDEQAKPGQSITVAPIPNIGLGQAINDRLTRAAAPKTDR